MTLGTIEETYEYRMKHILKKAFDEIGKEDVSLEFVSPEMFFDLLDDNPKAVTKALIDDMVEWMSEDDWLKLIRE